MIYHKFVLPTRIIFCMCPVSHWLGTLKKWSLYPVIRFLTTNYSPLSTHNYALIWLGKHNTRQPRRVAVFLQTYNLPSSSSIGNLWLTLWVSVRIIDVTWLFFLWQTQQSTTLKSNIMGANWWWCHSKNDLYIFTVLEPNTMDYVTVKNI